MESRLNNALVCVISVELFIPMAHSLKDKRKHIKSLKERLKNRFNASIAEISALDDWQRSVLGISMISNERRFLEKQYRAIEKLLEESREIQLIKTAIEWI
ncbi:MAG: DUF503 domain-containing protein [Gammaproteobacteria bacterium]|nr:DUF503 domain-containing protein [Gammaproteobacteria bacterium]